MLFIVPCLHFFVSSVGVGRRLSSTLGHTVTSPLGTWQSLLPGAFAGTTAPFGVHPNDRERALKMFRVALRQGATLSDVLVEAERYLRTERCSDQWIKKEQERIKKFRPCPYVKPTSSRSWLVTLEQDGSTEIISVLKAQRSFGFVRKYIEQYYISRFYSIHEKLLYSAQAKSNPYPSRFEEVNGNPYLGRIICGEDPIVYARLVKNLWIDNSSGIDVLKWEEQDIPQRVLDGLSSLP